MVCGVAVVKNLSCNVRDIGFIPGMERSHMPWGNKARVPQLLSLHSRVSELQPAEHLELHAQSCMPRAARLELQA